MTLKSVIRIIDSAKFAVIPIAAFLMLPLFFNAYTPVFIAIEILLFATAAALLLIRAVFIKRWLRNFKQPELLFVVLKKLDRSNLFVPDSLRSFTSYSYPTDQFLAENKLSTDIFLRSSRRDQNNSQPILRLTDKGLELEPGLETEKFISWKNIYDWSYESGDPETNRPDKIFINYYGDAQVIDVVAIDLDVLTTNHVELLLLITHFKMLYGQ